MKRRPVVSGMGFSFDGEERGVWREEMFAGGWLATSGAIGVGPEPGGDVGFDGFELREGVAQRMLELKFFGSGVCETGEEIGQWGGVFLIGRRREPGENLAAILGGDKC